MSERDETDLETTWSARKKADVVMRLLRGEGLEEVSRDVKVEAHRLAAWRDDFIASGLEGLKANPSALDDRRLKEAERKVGELTLENEILHAAARKRGLQYPAEEAAEVAVKLHAPIATVCRVLDAPRSTVYARRSNVVPIDRAKRGPLTEFRRRAPRSHPPCDRVESVQR